MLCIIICFIVTYLICCQVLQESKKQLLWCATPDAVVRAKQEEWSKIYNEEQQHKDLTQYLQQTLGDSAYTEIMAQVDIQSIYLILFVFQVTHKASTSPPPMSID